MTVERYELVSSSSGKAARVYHFTEDDPTCASWVSMVEVLISTHVRVGTPLACPYPLSSLEVQSVAQLLLGSQVTINPQPMDTIDDVGEKGCPRCWRAYEYSSTL